jgi:uroporphyrinogen decarboxylase
MADSRGTLVDPATLEAIWLPHFARAVRPLIEAGIRLMWHCDGNLMEMVPRLIEAGVSGFQGFQYEDGMDYEKISSMTDRSGRPLMIWAGVSVTTTLAKGRAEEVARELKWLVEHGPRTGLSLGASSSIAPGTDRRNVKTLIEGLEHYRKNGRRGR